MTTAEIRAKKSALRKKYKQIRSNIVASGKAELDEAIIKTVLGSMSYKYCKTVLLFSSIGSEPETEAIATYALADGKRVFFPRTYDGGIMKFYRINDISELQKNARFGINEPSEEAEEYAPDSTAELCIVPGLCFDKNGHRIGYGKGYYDRFLSKFKGVSAGLTYSVCISDEALAFEKRYDKSVDLIFSEKGVEIVAGKKKV